MRQWPLPGSISEQTSDSDMVTFKVALYVLLQDDCAEGRRI